MFNFDIYPMVADEKSILHGEVMTTFAHKYGIIGSCLSGAHFISETFDSYEDAADAFIKYCATVEYFDGGSCTLFEFSADNDFEVIKNVWIA